MKEIYQKCISYASDNIYWTIYSVYIISSSFVVTCNNVLINIYKLRFPQPTRPNSSMFIIGSESTCCQFNSAN